MSTSYNTLSYTFLSFAILNRSKPSVVAVVSWPIKKNYYGQKLCNVTMYLKMSIQDTLF